MDSREEFLKKLQPLPPRAKVWWILHCKGGMFADQTSIGIFFGTYHAFLRKAVGNFSLKYHYFSLSILGVNGERYSLPKKAPKIMRALVGYSDDRRCYETYDYVWEFV